MFLKSSGLAAATLLAAVFAAPAAAAPLEAWLGDWRNDESRDVVGVTIKRDEDGGLVVSALGACSPTPCEWGETPGIAHASSAGADIDADVQSILAVWDSGFSLTLMTLDMDDAGAVVARAYTRFLDDSGRTNYSSEVALSRAGLVSIAPGALGAIGRTPALIGALATPALPGEDCIPFDPTTVEAKSVSGRWKVVSGDMWMLDADQNGAEMTRAAEIIQHYGFNAQCFVGRGTPTIEYWKTSAGAPAGALDGEDCVGINPAGLSVRESGGRFTVLSDERHAAFSAPSQDLAERAIEVIGHYGFTKSCFVGRPDPSMRYLRR